VADTDNDKMKRRARHGTYRVDAVKYLDPDVGERQFTIASVVRG